MYVSTSVEGYQEKLIRGKIAGIKFIEQDIDINTLYDLLINGHTIQCCFGIGGEYKIEKGFEKNERFQQTNIVSVDLDNIDFCWEVIRGVISSVLPTIIYTTFSNGLEGKGYRYRLLYVFEQPIYSIELYKALYKAIAQRINNCGIEISDNCGNSVCQMMHGTNKELKGFNSKNYNKVFSFSSFLSPDQVNSIINTKGCNKVASCCNIVDQQSNQLRCSHSATQSHQINPMLVSDATTLDYKPFLYRYGNKYRYIYRKEKEDWIDYSYFSFQFIDEDYVRLPYFAEKIADGKLRKTFLYKNALLRKYIDPNVDIDTLFYCMVIDFHKFIDNTQQPLGVNDLIRLTTEAYNGTIYEDSSLIKTAKKKAPKSGIILKRGTYKNIGDHQHQIALIREQIGEKERHRTTIYRERKKVGLVEARNTDKDYSEISAKIDESLTRNANYKALREMGYRIGKNKVSELLNKKISEGNNLLDQVN